MALFPSLNVMMAMACLSVSPPPEAVVPPAPDLVEISGGEFTMGGIGPEARPDEFPRHRVRVDSFGLGRREVTNAEYAAFVAATGYRTVAERPVDWEDLKKQVPPGTPQPPDELLQPGSLVFTGTDRPVSMDDFSQWWSWTRGADWRHPEGPDSSIEDRMDHPVVHVAFEDAVAYCDWIGGRLPTESEWEFAARGGLADQPFIWGEAQIDETRANTWNGRFPDRNTAADGYVRTAPVGRYPANGYGLLDMGGNVWEWCGDRYRADEYRRRVEEVGPDGVVVNPAGPADTRDPRNPFSPVSRVQRGGSFLCNPSYCSSYRPSARMATTPDSGASHVGFRVAMTMEQWKAARDRVAKSAEATGASTEETGADPATVKDAGTSESALDRE
ncbi:MAG: formylglycine-generating enzyme family protein [Phycisphaeraceae bacterium]|nr:formylglycine-generating enzyme family protein [Phycisphaeraceae bacterium]